MSALGPSLVPWLLTDLVISLCQGRVLNPRPMGSLVLRMMRRALGWNWLTARISGCVDQLWWVPVVQSSEDARTSSHLVCLWSLLCGQHHRRCILWMEKVIKKLPFHFNCRWLLESCPKLVTINIYFVFLAPAALVWSLMAIRHHFVKDNNAAGALSKLCVGRML